MVAMIESELSLFEVHSKGVLRDPVELSQSMLGITPKRFNRMDHTVGVNFAANNGLQRSFGGIGNDLGVDAVAPFEKAKDNSFATCATSSFAPNAFGAVKSSAKRRTS